MKPLSPDLVIEQIDTALRTLHGVLPASRANPAEAHDEATLDPSEKALAGRLMRINHCGEICAQALYLGQGLTSDSEDTQRAMRRAAEEEADHLAWCEQRIRELDTHTSYLNPAFWALSYAGGAVSGLIGDRFNLGFVAATEEQVVRHLDQHLDRLPEKDLKSRAILSQMRTDEDEHRTTALRRGGIDFPKPVKRLMTTLSRVMTRTAYWV